MTRENAASRDAVSATKCPGVKRERELTWRMSKNVGKRRDGDETSEARASVDRT